MIKLFIVYLFTGLTLFLTAPKISMESVFAKSEKFYSGNDYYSYYSRYKIFENKQSNKIVQEYSGIVLKKNKVSYQMMNKVKAINFGTYSMVIDEETKKIQVSQVVNDNAPIAISSYLKLFSKHRVINDPTYFVYYLFHSTAQKQLEGVTLYIDKTDFSIHKQIFYLTGSQELKKNNTVIKIVNPRLEVTYFKREKNLLKDEKMIRQSNYFNISNNKINLAKGYKTYNLTLL